MQNVSASIVESSRNEYGDEPNLVLYTMNADGTRNELFTLTFNQAQTLGETIMFHVEEENRDFNRKYGDFFEEVL